ncbi:MAG: MFS transporter [Lachnospiraceae bacterium]
MSTGKKRGGFGKFLLLWSGEFISSIGGGLTSFGLGVYVFNQTGSAASMALVTLLGFLPTILLSVPAGGLADRYDRRVLMMLGDGCSALGIGYILFCMLRGGASLTQICVGVFISAVFSSLLEPSYRATVSDLLTKEEFSKASGLVSLAGSARYLISPALAGILLAAYDVKLLLILDIATFAWTIASTAVVKHGIETKMDEVRVPFMESIKEGWSSVQKRKGIFLLILVSSVMTLFLGVFQVLAEPLILAFADSKTLGIGETVCACGMLVSSLFLGMFGIKKNYTGVLSLSLSMAGIFMVFFGIWENIYLICIFGFAFFAMLPFANNCLDYLVRTNIPDELQGRTWGFIGFLSQLGYVFAYGFSGILADMAGMISGKGVGRGAAFMIKVSGILLVVVAVSLLGMKKIKALEQGSEMQVQ